MQSAQGTSLLFALLEIGPQTSTPPPYQVPTPVMPYVSSTQAAKYRNLDPGDREKVLRGLYRALYFILDDYEMPYNRSLSRAIGKALSMGIREEMAKSNPDKDIIRLFNMLKPVVIEAIDELAP